MAAPQPMTRDLQAELLAVTLFSHFAIGVWQGGGIIACNKDKILYITNGKQYFIHDFLIIGNIIINNILEGGFTFNKIVDFLYRLSLYLKKKYSIWYNTN